MPESLMEPARRRWKAELAFDGDEITAIGPADQIQIPQGAQVVNVEGKTIIP